MQGLSKAHQVFIRRYFCYIVEPAPLEVVDQPMFVASLVGRGERGKPYILQVEDCR